MQFGSKASFAWSWYIWPGVVASFGGQIVILFHGLEERVNLKLLRRQSQPIARIDHGSIPAITIAHDRISVHIYSETIAGDTIQYSTMFFILRG